MAEAKNKRPKLICGAMKANGQPCRQRAGHGTSHFGSGRCHTHETRETDLVQTVGKLGVQVPTSPAAAIQGVLDLSCGQLLYVNAEVLSLERDEYFDEKGRHNRYVKWQDILMERVASYARVATDMGVAERSINLAEQQTVLVTKVLKEVMEELDLTDEQRRQVGPAVRTVMTRTYHTRKEGAFALSS